jgi:hypothetical protein
MSGAWKIRRLCAESFLLVAAPYSVQYEIAVKKLLSGSEGRLVLHY